MDLAIIIVNYHTFHYTCKTLESILEKDHPFSYQIYVVDNASADGSLDKLKDHFYGEVKQGLVEFIASPENKGFAHANNLALKKIQSKYILLLNSDTKIQGDCLENCLHYLEKQAEVGALGCKILLEDGSLDKACRRSFPTPLVSFYRMIGLSRLFPKIKRFNQYNLSYLDPDKTYPVDGLSGAFMMFRSGIIEEVGYLDEDYFMYGEDLDWCYRIKNRGWKVVYHGGAEIIHYKGASSGPQQKNKLIYEFHRAMYIFYKKHYKNKYPWIVTALVYTGIGGRYLLQKSIYFLKR